MNIVSVITPTFNEEKALPATLEALSRQKGTYEVIVVDGGSSDRTRDIVEAEPRLRFEIAAKGRAVQMNVAARQARGEWLLFLHADTLLPEGFSWPQTMVRSPTYPWMALLGPMRFSPPAHLTSRHTISRFQDKIEIPMFQVISGALRTDMEMVRQIK